jgi:hypothetical protein
VHAELVMRVLEGPPGAVFTGVQPVRFHQPPCYRLVDSSPNLA